MSLHKYVLLCNDGTSHDLSRRTRFTEQTFDLPELLEQGWRPVHDTLMGRVPWYDSDGEEEGEYSVVLILLVKD
jgi:hypothetical protein